MIRARFYIRKDDCDNDYRPVKWPIKYPYWCSAESSNSFVLVAYAEDEDSIKELWPEAYDINVLEKDVERHIVKDNRFEDICFKSGLLYNYVLYNIRQGIFSGNYLKEFDLSNKLCK